MTGGASATIRFTSGTVSKAQFEPGTVATPFERRQYGEELVLCQRYYQKSYSPGIKPGTAVGAGTNGVIFSGASSNSLGGTVPFQVCMRTAPTYTLYDGSGAAGKISYYTTSWVNNGALNVHNKVTATGIYVSTGTATIGLGFDWTAESEL